RVLPRGGPRMRSSIHPLPPRPHALPRSVSISALATALAVGSFAFVASGCSKEEKAGPQTCCDQPKIPPGIPAFTVVRDEVTGPSDGQEVKIHVALKQKTRRDDIYAAMQFLYRYA